MVPSSLSERTRLALVIALSALIATTVAVFVYGFDGGVSSPLSVDEDATGVLAAAKNLAEGGSVYHNAWLGAPGTQLTYDYPNTDGLNIALLALLARTARNPVVAVNLFLLLTFALAAASASFAAVRVRVWEPAAVLVGVAFALLPFHFYRGVTHLFISNYWVVPLAIWFAIELMWDPNRRESGAASESAGRTSKRRRWLWTCLVCVAIGSSGVYYAVLSCMLFVVAGLYGSRRYGRRTLYRTLVLIGVVALVFVAQALPGALYHVREGRNPGAVERSAMGAELYGFRLGQLVLPSTGHRIPALRSLARSYAQGLEGLGYERTEAQDSASLGVLGSLGFLSLFVLLLLARETKGRGEEDPEGLLHRMSLLGVAVFCIGVGGGIGSFVGLFFPLIRAYNRVSVFAGLLGLMVVGVFLTWLARRATSSPARIAVAGVCVVLIAFAIFDQVPVDFDNRVAAAAEWDAMGAYVGQAEAMVARGTQVFQLPYVPYPEYPPVFRMKDYDHLKPYLHSEGVRWSYGAVKGRSVSEWQRQTSALPPGAMIHQLRRAGFGGLWIDRFGYGDNGEAVIDQIAEALGELPLSSANGRYAFFLLR